MRAGIALVLVLAPGCAPARTGANVEGAPAARADGAAEALAATDAGAPRVCVHDPKDLATCPSMSAK